MLVLMAVSPVVLATLATRSSSASEPVSVSPATQRPAKAEITDQYGKLPLSFESNEGQTNRDVKFLSRGLGYDLFLTATGAVLNLQKARPPADKFKPPSLSDHEFSNATSEAAVLRLKMIGANSQSNPVGEDPLPGKINYLVGDDPDKWRVNIPTYRKVHYAEIYPKVDLVYYGNQSELEYDFVVAPGGDVQAIRFQIEGSGRMTLDSAGDLHLAVEQSEVTLRKPVIYQLTDEDDRREVKGEYVIRGNEVRFETEPFDRRKPLIIDPVLSYSTLLGGGSNEYASGIAVDSSGSAYVTGHSDSGGFPTTPGAYRTTSSIYGNAFVTKLDPTGTSLVYSTYISGNNGGTSANSVAVDSSGNAYITGRTSASDFPLVNPIKTKRSFFKTTDGAASWNNNNNLDIDVNTLAIAPSAPSTIYAGTFAGPYKSTDGGATWLATQTAGLPAFPSATALAIDPGNPLVVYAGMINGGLYKTIDGGASWSSVPVALNGAGVFSIVFDPSTPSTIYLGSGNSVFKSTDNGSTWTQLTNFGIPGTPNVRTLAIDPTNPAIIYAGTFGSGTFKTTNSGSSWTAINAGMAGSFKDYVNSIAIDVLNPSVLYAGSGNSTIGGSINKSTNGGSTWAPVNTGVPNFQISALIADRTNSQTVYAATTGGGVIKTTNGGSSWVPANAGLWKGSILALGADPANPAILYAGSGGSAFIDDDAFVSELNASGTALLFSTYLGGSSNEGGSGIGVDGSGNVVVAGQTTSTNFPAVNAIKSTLSASDTCGDGFVTKLHLAGPSFVYSTYLGGAGCDVAYGVAVDASANAYITGTTTSANFPILNAFQSTIADSFNGDAFVTKLNMNGALVYSTFLGGEGSDSGNGIAVDASGNAYITGSTGSNSFPLSNPIQSTNLGGDAFVTKLNSAGSGLVYSTFLGGSSNEGGVSIAVDSGGNAYITGSTQSADFPVVAGALRTKSPFFKSADGGGVWNNDNYGLRSDIATELALDPTKPSTLYAGTRSDVYKSTDGGQNWNPSGNGLVKPSVVAMVVNPTAPSTIYLGSNPNDPGNSSGVFKSTNGGNTWNAANTGLGNTSVLSLAIDPITPSTLYAGVYGSGIFKSVDGGANWAIHTSPSVWFIQTIAVDPSNPNTVYVGANSSPGGVSKSTDGGVSWQLLGNGLTGDFVSGLAIDAITPSTIYASTNEGLFKSIDSGLSWTSLGSFGGSLVIDPITSTTLYRFSSGGVFKSIDSGNNWSPINNGLTYPFVSSLIVNPKTPAMLYVGVNVYPPDDDAFVAKLNSSGTALIYSTLLGGSPAPNDSFFLNDEGNAIAVDSLGNAYVAGASRSPDFPVTPNAFQPFNRGFTDAFVSKLTMSYIISGHVLDGNNAPVIGASVTLSDGSSLSSVVTDTDGAYQFSRLREGGNFTVSAAKPQFTMTPASQSFNDLHSNQTVDFIAAPTNAAFYTVSGHITNNSDALAGVTVTLSGSQQGIATADGNGLYSFTLAGGGNYTVTPSLLGFTFTPGSQTFNNLSGNQTANFAATRQNVVVINANDHGPGSLRQAILDANATVGTDMIVFNIPGAGVKTINLLFALPEITDAVVIDATTQPGYAGAPLIELNGAQTNSNSAGFRISAGGSTIRGFVIGAFDWGILLIGGNNNVIQANYIGVDPTGTLVRGNDEGISIFNSSNNLIGGTSPAARNVISGNGFDGVEVAGEGNQIQGNFIGTNASGSAALPNGVNGIDIGGSAQSGNNTVGGTAPGAGNLISGNQRGVNCSSSSNVIQGNLIGVNATATAAVGNNTGISASAGTLVGGTVPGARNLISGNTGDGVSISGPGSLLQGNFIGTDITGTSVLGNGGSGVVAGNGALVGGTTPEARNVISGNGGFGNISLGSNNSGTQATVQGNYIGTDVTGNVALNNPLAGISISGSSNLIGGLTPGSQNVISGNKVGIQIGGSIAPGPIGNTIQGNIIGLNAMGASPLPNSLAGIRINDSSNNIIGGAETGAGNRICFNSGPGVSISSGTGNSILGNSIFSNNGLGIDLSPTGVTANDPGDADTGANNIQNFPLLTSVGSGAGSTTIQGTLNSKPNTSFRIDFYSNAACDPLGNGEGARFFDTTNVTTDANGAAAINFISSMTLASGRVLTATATDPAGNTSEFSPCDSSNAIGSIQFNTGTYKVSEDVGNALITLIRAGGSKGTVSVNYSTADGTATAGSDYTAVSGTLVFADGETSKTFSIPVANDGVPEADETVQLVLSAVTDLEALGNPVIATMTIQDSSTPLVLTMNSIDVPEGDSGNTNATVTVTLSAQTGKTISVDYNTSAVSATSGVDYVAASGSLTFSPGVMTQPITVSIIGDTISESDETFRVVLSNPVNAIVGNLATVRILDDDRPTITPVAVSRQRGSAASNSTIANVTDPHQALDTLTVTVNNGASATSNGVTVSNISVNAAGVVTADVIAACTSNSVGFALKVTNSTSGSANALLVVTVTANDPPAVGNYPDSTVLPGGTIAVTPAVAPSDNNSVTSVTAVAAPASFAGTLSGNTATGAVTVMGANPPGDYTVTVTLTDNCNLTTTRSFTLTVSSCMASLSKSSQSFNANGGPDTFTVMINADCPWTAVSNNPNWITVTSGSSGTGNGTVNYSVGQNLNVDSRTGTLTVAGQTFTVAQSGISAAGLSYFKMDFDSDNKTELGFHRAGLWGFLKSGQTYSTGSPQFFSWGGGGLQPICADFDGDGKADIGYIVPPGGGQSATYSILLSSRGYSFASGQPLFIPAGFPSLGDIPVVGDFDGDGKGDPGIWRASQGVWILPTSSSSYTNHIFAQWGQLGDIPVAADFDHDGKADIGFYRDGLWGILQSSHAYSTGSPLFFSWGGAGLQPIIGDFDGDGKSDIGYMVPPSSGQSAAYAILLSSQNYGFGPGQPLFVSAGFPSLGDTQVIGDFDGDGKADPGIWRESQGVWIIPLSSTSYSAYIFSQWGQPGDIAFPNSAGRH